MASTQDLKRRVRSISNTRKLTRAMELVASARLRPWSRLVIGLASSVVIAGLFVAVLVFARVGSVRGPTTRLFLATDQARGLENIVGRNTFQFFLQVVLQRLADDLGFGLAPQLGANAKPLA